MQKPVKHNAIIGKLFSLNSKTTNTIISTAFYVERGHGQYYMNVSYILCVSIKLYLQIGMVLRTQGQPHMCLDMLAEV